ncbi:hypothetical protein N7470_005434 [Penicillium chermesinum]|nr:hypothetical protein N7470_005434 [Penicillium chermesinum]
MMASMDPYKQNITIASPDGIVPVSIRELQFFVHYNQTLCINYAAQLGASIILFVMLLLMTRRRGSWVFCLNAVALVLNILRLLLQIIHYSTGLEDIYSYFTGDYSEVPTSAFAVSVMAVVFETMLIICFEISLVLQVQVVCLTLRRRYRYSLLALSIAVALIPIGFRLAYMVGNCREVMTLSPWSDSLMWLERTTPILITISICFFCAIFVGKLWYAIRQRRRLGVRDFGPMKIIFVCGCQTLFIPAIVTILQFMIHVPEFGSNALTLVTISLPLSSIWAGVTLDHIKSTGSNRSRMRNLWQKFTFDSESTLRNNSVATELAPTAKTFCYSKGSNNAATYGISVERNISVSSVHEPAAMI